jgi:phosphatidate cytidylyltransferase
LLKRTLVAIPALVLLVLVIFLDGIEQARIFAQVIVAAVGVLCMHEMLNTVSKDSKPLRLTGYGFAILSFPAYQYTRGYSFAGVAVLYLIAMMCIFVALIFFERDAKDGFMTIFSLSYPGMFYIFLISLTCVEDASASQFLMIMAFGAAIVTDTFAYFTGMLLGRHKLAVNISPKKTIEGAIGGTVFCMIAVYLFGYFTSDNFGLHVEKYWYIILGFVLSVLAQLGDLTASKVKRKFGVKDYGKIMGEHGGAIDRLDSILFVAPAVLAFYRFIAT